MVFRNFPARAFCDPSPQELVAAPVMPSLPRSLSAVPGFTKEAANLPSRLPQRRGCTQLGPWSVAFHPLEVLRGLRGGAGSSVGTILLPWWSW